MGRNKLNLIRTLSIILISAFCMSSCSDYGYGEDEGGDGRVLDSNLYGTWTYDSSDNVTIWKFKSNGDCLVTSYGNETEWLWEIEGGQIKLYVTGGTPIYYSYKIEGDKLYLSTDGIDGWGLPLTKQ